MSPLSVTAATDFTELTTGNTDSFYLRLEKPVNGNIYVVGHENLAYDKWYTFKKSEDITIRFVPNSGYRCVYRAIGSHTDWGLNADENGVSEYKITSDLMWEGVVSVWADYNYINLLKFREKAKDGNIRVKEADTHKEIFFDEHDDGYKLVAGRAYDIYYTNKSSYPADFNWAEASPQKISQYGYREGEKPVVYAKLSGDDEYYDIDDCGDNNPNTWHMSYKFTQPRSLTLFWSYYDYVIDNKDTTYYYYVTTHAYEGGRIEVTTDSKCEPKARLKKGDELFCFNKQIASSVQITVIPNPGYEIKEVDMYMSALDKKLVLGKSKVSSNGKLYYTIDEKEWGTYYQYCYEIGIWPYFTKKTACTHKSKKTVVKNYQPATCKHSGYSGDTYCKDCNSLIKKGKVLSAKKHVPGSERYKAATVKSDGYSGFVYCKECKQLLSQGEFISRPKSIVIRKNTYAYSGKRIKPNLIVTDEKGDKISSNNYSISYLNNIIGTAKIRVKFKGRKYSGTLVKNFYIKLSIPKLSSVKRKSKNKITVSWSKVSLADGYQINYTWGNISKNITITGNKKTDYVIDKTVKGKQYIIKIRSYKKIGKKKYFSDWSKGIEIKAGVK